MYGLSDCGDALLGDGAGGRDDGCECVQQDPQSRPHRLVQGGGTGG